MDNYPLAVYYNNVSIRPAYHFLAIIFASVFLCLQAGALAHDSQESDITHHQDCVLCHLVSSDDIEFAVPTSSHEVLEPLRFKGLSSYSNNYKKRVYITPQGRAPPPRSPPLAYI